MGEVLTSREIIVDPLAIETLNGFIRFSLRIGVLGQENASRILITSEDAHREFLETDVQAALQSATDHEDIQQFPVAPGLRTVFDFDYGEEVLLKSDVIYSNALKGTVFAAGVFGYIGIDTGSQALFMVEPTFAGLFKTEEYEYYRTQHPGSGKGGNEGTPPTKTYVNLELTRLLAHCGVGNEPDDDHIKNLKRLFEVKRGPYFLRNKDKAIH